jgi:two-component system OmpR family sensor kinase
LERDSSQGLRQLEARIQSLESELAERRQQIEDLESSWEQWLKLISHDFRGPLTLVLGYVQAVLHHLPPGPSFEQDRRDLMAAINATQRLDKMVGQIVDAARLEAHILPLTPTEVDVVPIVREQIRKARRRYPDRMIRVSVPNVVPTVVGDARRLGQMIGSLLSNAVLFSPPTTDVSVSVSRVDDMVEIAVADQGIGLTEDEKQHLFEKFYRPERAQSVRREGLGLSLLVVAGIAEMLNGQLRVESPGPDRGSTFHLRLPVATIAPPATD